MAARQANHFLVKVREIIKRIEADGWAQVRQRGSHGQLGLVGCLNDHAVAALLHPDVIDCRFAHVPKLRRRVLRCRSHLKLGRTGTLLHPRRS